MEVGSVFFLMGIGILAVGLLLRPFFLAYLVYMSPQKKLPTHMEDVECIALREEKNRLLKLVHDLDFDHKLGKIPDEVYQEQRKELVSRGAVLLKRMHQINCVDVEPFQKPSKDSPRSYQEAVYDPSDELEEIIAQHRRKQPERSLGFCAQCGTPYKRSDRFCPKCGHLTRQKSS